jgi:hypothetical protein
VLAFPRCDTATARIDPEAVRCGLSNPCTDSGAFRYCRLVDRIGEVGGK